MLKEKLIDSGLSETEATVYLALLENNRLTPARISKITGIKRPTVYAVSEELTKKGIIQKDDSGKTIHFIAGNPHDLLTIIKKERRKLAEKEEQLKSVISEIELIPKNTHYSVPKVRVIQEADIEDFMYQRADAWTQSMLDAQEHTWYGFRDSTVFLLPKQQKFVKWYWKQAPKEISMKVFGNSTPAERNAEKSMERHMPSRREIRFLKDVPFTANQWVVGEYIINYITGQKPNYMVEIRDRLLADNLRVVYKKLWQETNQS